MRRYSEFTIWNEKEERAATAEEIHKHVRIVVMLEEHLKGSYAPINPNAPDGRCRIEVDKGYSLGVFD